MAEWRNGRNNGRMAEWQNGRMAEMATYILFMVHAEDLYLFSTFARTYFVVLHMVQKLLGERRTYPPF